MLSQNDTSVFFHHSVRPEWGLAIMTAEFGSKRRYQFEDGQLRTIAQGYYHMLEAATAPTDANSRMAQLLVERDLGRARRRLDELPKAMQQEMVALRQQIDWFERTYPNGFAGDAWIAAHRSRATGKQLKRHRDTVLEDAKALLSREALVALTTPEAAVEWQSALAALLKRTDCARKQDVESVIGTEEPLRLVRALERWLYVDTSSSRAFHDVAHALMKPTWSLVTTIAALARPDEHVAVSTAAFTRLASFVNPEIERLGGCPDRRTYDAILNMTALVRLRLEQRGHEPLDLMDVRDFIVDSLRPKVMQEIKAAGAAASPRQSRVG